MPFLVGEANDSCLKALPFQIKGCIGEMCDVVLETLPSYQTIRLFKTPDINSEVIDSITECENFKKLEQYLLITGLNSAKITHTGNLFKKHKLKIGDLISLTHYTGEGTWAACIGDEIIQGFEIEGEISMLGGLEDRVEFLSKEITKPKTWAFVTTQRDKSGWTDQKFWIGKYDDEKELLKKCRNLKPNKDSLTL